MMGLMGLMEIGGICMVLYVMCVWIINLSDFHQECPSDGCPILHSHSIPSKILHIHTYTTPILILSMNLNSAECNFMPKVIYEAETERDVTIWREESFIAIKDFQSSGAERIIRSMGKETIVESFLRR